LQVIVQRPATHAATPLAAVGQTLPHVPQLRASVCKSTQRPRQRSGVGATQPDPQRNIAGPPSPGIIVQIGSGSTQLVPHTPQFIVVPRSVSQPSVASPLQSPRFAMHARLITHSPATQRAAPGSTPGKFAQSRKHAPQLRGSTCVSVHVDPHTVRHAISGTTSCAIIPLSIVPSITVASIVATPLSRASVGRASSMLSDCSASSISATTSRRGMSGVSVTAHATVSVAVSANPSTGVRIELSRKEVSTTNLASARVREETENVTTTPSPRAPRAHPTVLLSARARSSSAARRSANSSANARKKSCASS
jgi:hypothetical protein